jgi:hypothetical protein
MLLRTKLLGLLVVVVAAVVLPLLLLVTAASLQLLVVVVVENVGETFPVQQTGLGQVRAGPEASCAAHLCIHTPVTSIFHCFDDHHSDLHKPTQHPSVHTLSHSMFAPCCNTLLRQLAHWHV